jgi:uncharacterized protein YdaU (DUF1376 family)
MKNGPAFQLYAKDFLVGTAHMSPEAVGGYMRLLCYQWENGGILNTDDMLIALTGCRIDAIAEIRAKFAPSKKDGLLRNKKLEKVRRNQAAFRAVKSRNASNGWRKRRSVDAVAMQPQCESYALRTPTSSPECTKQERESADRPSWQEVREYAASPHCGLAEWKAEDWFREMEGAGWLDYRSRPIDKWRSVLLRVKTRWEADGRPMQPPSNAPQLTQGRPSRALTPLDLKTIRDAKISLADAIKQKHAAEGALGTTWNDEGKKQEWIGLRREIRNINEQLSKLA